MMVSMALLTHVESMVRPQDYKEVKMEKKWNLSTDVGLLFARVAIGLAMLLGHGLPKIQNFAVVSEKFPALFGMSSSVNLSLAIFAELFCSLLLILGVGTRFALFQLMATMSVAIYAQIILWKQTVFAKPGEASAEMAMLYLIIYISLFILGPGRLSLDHIIKSKKKPAAKKKK